MPGTHCVVVGCGNGSYHIERWRGNKCETHQCMNGKDPCNCEPPFILYTFPTEKNDPNGRARWIKMIYRKETDSHKNWQPRKNSRVCSKHFFEGKPSEMYPDPCLQLGYPSPHISTVKKRKQPCERKPLVFAKKKSKMQDAVDNTCVEVDVPPQSEEATEPIDAVAVESDHAYVSTCSCSSGCTCLGCHQKQARIMELCSELDSMNLNSTGTSHQRVSTSQREVQKTDIAEKYVKTDKRVQLNTGLVSRDAFDALLMFVTPRASRMRYWTGARTVSTKVRRVFRGTPTKSGPKRKLTIKSELVLVLMKLRLGLSNEFLAMSFAICASTCSNILSTWIRFLAHLLKNLVFWPEKTVVQRMMPSAFAAKYPNLRCTLDCSETFIERPRDLKMQAATWSDYKHHNTVKYLVGISPNGHICFMSRSWGGRTSDRHIVQNSGFLDLVDPTDVIMADRGFTIQEDLLLRQATLLIPPSSSGKNQMSRENVIKTKKIANARIHVERAINRLKWFKIVSQTLPLTMVHLFDDILLVCSALCNLRPPLVL